MAMKNADQIEGTYRRAPERTPENETPRMWRRGKMALIAALWLSVLVIANLIGVLLHLRYLGPLCAGITTGICSSWWQRVQAEYLRRLKLHVEEVTLPALSSPPHPAPVNCGRTHNDGDHLVALERERFRNGRCPDCDSQELQAGPCGGIAQNVRCAECGSGFNDMGPFGVDRITNASR